MSELLNPAQETVLAQLRGDPNDRPKVDPTLRRDIQDQLEQALKAVEGPLTIDKHMLNKVHACEGNYMADDDFEWSPANAKGIIVHKAVELMINGTKQLTPDQLVSKAIDWICESRETQSLADYIRGTSDAERAELRNNASDLVIKFMEMFPPLKGSWHPNAEATTAAFVGNKRVVFRGKIDLKLGALQADRSSTLLIDMKTGNPTYHDLDDLRFYALLETLRTGVPPYRTANAYLAAGRAEHEDVTEDVLWSAAKRTAEGTIKIAELHYGRTPVLTPGSACRFCPANTTCPEAQSSQD